jgi:hypothetical protein
MRVTGQLVLDEYVASVVEFMEAHLPADRLEYVAERMPAIAKVLWSSDRCALYSERSIVRNNQTPSNATLCLSVHMVILRRQRMRIN